MQEAEFAEAASQETPPERLEELSQQEELRVVIAANAATPASVLKRLGREGESRVRQAVVGNPNAPLETLYRLACEFPREFLANPLLPLLEITNPLFLQKMSGVTLLHLLRCEDFPSHWLQQIQQNPQSFSYGKVRERIVETTTMRGPVGVGWRKLAEEAVKVSSGHFSCHRMPADLWLLSYMVQPKMLPDIGNSDDLVKPHLALYSPDMDATTLTGLEEGSRHYDWFLRIAIAGHARTPIATLIKMASDKLIGVRQALARNLRTPDEVLRQLAGDQSVHVRQAVATHRYLSVFTQMQLAIDDQVQVRRALACNPHIAAEILHRLTRSQESSIRQATARHPRLLMEDLRLLTRDAVPKVRAATASHPLLDKELSRLLLHDSSTHVRAALAFHPALDEDLYQLLARDLSSRVHISLACNAALPLSCFSLLIQDTDADVLTALARHSRLPAEYYALLFQMENEAVSAALAANTQTPPDLLQQLLNHPSPKVRASLAGNKNAPLEPLSFEQDAKILIKLALNPATSSAILRRLAQVNRLEVQVAVAAHPRTPADILTRMCASDERAIWQKLARNPSTPIPVLKQLFILITSEKDPSGNCYRDWLYLAWHPAILADQQQFLFEVFREKSRRHILSYPHLSKSYWTSFDPSILLQPFLPLAMLELFASSPFWEERYRVTRHPAATEALLETLSHDGHCYVRASASEHLNRIHRGTAEPPSIDSPPPSLFSVFLRELKKYFLRLYP